MTTTVLAMSAQRVLGVVLLSVCGSIVLFVVLVAVVLGVRHRRAYHPRELRSPRPRRFFRWRWKHAGGGNDGVLEDQDTDRYDTDTWESSPR